MTIPEIVSVIKDVALGLAAATTAIVAFLGLQKWRQELEGKAHFEAARNLIRSTYRLRDELRNCRSPMIWSYEFPTDYKDSLSSSTEEEARAWGHVYKNRWNPVWTALQEFDSHTLEAEALWGAEIRRRTDDLRQCAGEVSAAMQASIDDKKVGGENFKSDAKFGATIRAVVAASGEETKNPLNVKIAAAISGIEEEVRPHLRRI